MSLLLDAIMKYGALISDVSGFLYGVDDDAAEGIEEIQEVSGSCPGSCIYYSIHRAKNSLKRSELSRLTKDNGERWRGDTGLDILGSSSCRQSINVRHLETSVGFDHE